MGELEYKSLRSIEELGACCTTQEALYFLVFEETIDYQLVDAFLTGRRPLEKLVALRVKDNDAMLDSFSHPAPPFVGAWYGGFLADVARPEDIPELFRYSRNFVDKTNNAIRRNREAK